MVAGLVLALVVIGVGLAVLNWMLSNPPTMPAP